jgi:hypothetical protein
MQQRAGDTMPSLRKARSDFQIIGRNTVNATWNGVGTVLAVNQNVVMPQTANGTMIFGWINQATINTMGQLSLTSGSSNPDFLNAPAMSAQPGVYIHNWRANNLSVTNVSLNNATPIWISAYGPGVPGQTSQSLPPGGTPVPLATGQSAKGTALPQYMRLVLKSSTPQLCIFAIIGGPADSTGNNGYVIAVNAIANTGPDTGTPPPPGYYATTMANAFPFQFNWGAAAIYVVNMSPATASGAQVSLAPL